MMFIGVTFNEMIKNLQVSNIYFFKEPLQKRTGHTSDPPSFFL